MSAERIEQLAERLESIVVDLDDLSFDVLQEAAAAGGTRRPDADKQLTQARRAADKASQVLRRLLDHQAS